MSIFCKTSKIVAPALAAMLLVPAMAGAQDLPSGVSAADVEAFRAAIVAAGCEIRDDDQAGMVEQATGFDEEKLGALAEYLIATGELSFTPELPGLGLTSEECGDDNDDDDDD